MMAEAAAHYAAGRMVSARQSCEAVIRADPDHGDAHHLIGVLLLDQGDAHAAVPTLQKAVALLPGRAQAQYHLGNALLAAGRPQEAEHCFRAAIGIEPNHVDALNNLGNALMAAKRHAEAAACFQSVLTARPGFPPALFNLGSVFMARDQPEAAESCYREALKAEASRPDPERFALVWCDLGVALMAQGDHRQAIDCFEQALLRAPGHSLAIANRALALLSLGRFREGWKGYESRWDLPGFAPPEADLTPTPGTYDPAAMAGRTVLLRYEQGRGDTLQFVRYAPLLAAHGAEVHLFVQSGLGALLSSVEGVRAVHEAGDKPPPACDAVWPLASLPRAFGTELATIPTNIPYVRATPERVDAWRTRLMPFESPRIGIAWSGAAGHGHDHLRSIPADRFGPLLRLRGCSFHLLQTEIRDRDQAWISGQASPIDHRSALTDYAETAAAVSLMDLVITVDTGLAHLAGALGRTVWILLPFSAEWRWLTERSDSPWYPTARLFRQSTRGDWSTVMAEVEAALAHFLAQTGSRAS
jgi:tetratricopeptide (TPR) repeat protein